ncbi:site-specific recombinase [Arthrobacter agilis]|nr:site-specific recombinase [Arthrobacter agilis]PPB47350.1 site-specific recombinase [Arthrobacter agilis]TPV22860.1 site-specific recombinase [Arthrobacter agilis]
MAAKIRVNWPDGPVCGICFTTALRTQGTCVLCGDERLLPGRTAEGANICRDCAGITTTMTCDGCGAETERFRAGRCIRCVLKTDLEQLLHPNNPPDLRLKRLIGVLAEADRPESVYTWMRGAKTRYLLEGLGTRTIALTHEAFDALPGSRSVEYLRELLIHHGMLEDRDRQLAAFERWLTTRILDLAGTPHIQAPIERFARWHHLKRLRAMAAPETDLNTAVRSAKQEITESGKFLTWLNTTHGLTSTGIRQTHVNEYLATGPSTRHAIRTFIVWLMKNKDIPQLDIAHRYAATTPLITQHQRIELIRHCIESNEPPLTYRVAALILLLFGQPVGKIAALKCSDLQALPDGLHLNLGNVPVLVPAQIAPMFWEHLHHRPNQQTGNRGNQWLFPGTIPGQHLHADAMMGQLRALGINLNGARNTALRGLVQELPPTLVANALGYSYQVIHKHATDAGTTMASYAGKITHPTPNPSKDRQIGSE